MGVTGVVGWYYLLLTVYLLVPATTLRFGSTAPAVLVMWLCYAAFRLGALPPSRQPGGGTAFAQRLPSWLSGGRKVVLLAAVCLCSYLVARFYTGQTIGTTVDALLHGESLYRQYQAYFRQNRLDAFSFGKVPFILMAALVKFALISGFVSLVALKARPKLSEWAFLLALALPYLYYSITRGTSLELFELFALIVFCLAERSVAHGRALLAGKARLGVGLLAVLCALAFSRGVAIRGDLHGSITREIRYDPAAFLSRVAPGLAALSFNLVGYFGFGFYYTSVAVRQIWLRSFRSFLAGLVPGGFNLVGVQDFTREICGSKIDCGVAWIPDSARLLNSVGFLGLLSLCFLLGLLLRFAQARRVGGTAVIAETIAFMIFMEMISLPVGNLLVVSSPNVVIIGLLTLASIPSFARIATRLLRGFAKLVGTGLRAV